MKTIISLLLVVALFAFLCVTNPTTEEFAAWYTNQIEEAVGSDASMFEEAFTVFAGHLATYAQRDDYTVCSVFTYDGHKTLGIGLMFFPIDALSEQAGGLRDVYAEWLEANLP